MIDTIKFYIPIKDFTIIEKIRGNLTRFKKDDLKTGKVEFEFYTANVKLGSYNRTVMVRVNNNPQGLFIEFSVPKYAKGNNVEMIYPHDLISIMEKFQKELCEFLSYFDLPDFSEWIIYRLDVCYNWIFENKEETISIMNFIQRIDYPRKKKYIYDTSVMHKGSAYTVKFYIKGEEFRKNDFKKVDPDKSLELLSWANRIVRFEVNLKRRYLDDFLGLKNTYVRDIANDEIILGMLKHYLDKTFFYINTKTMTNSEITQILLKNFSKAKATRLFQFYKGFYFDPETKNLYLQGGLNPSTIYRHKKDLKNVGIGFSGVDSPTGKGILEQLVIPSENSKFDLLIDYSKLQV